MLLALRRYQVCLPLLRHLVEKSSAFNCSGLFAKGRHILRPVINLIILLVTASEGASSTVVVKKFNVVKEDFCLYHLTSQRRRQSVLVGVNHHKACFAHGQRSIAKHRERILRQGQQRSGVCLPQFLNGNLVNVVVTLGIRFAPVPQVVLVKLLKGGNGGNRHKSVLSAVPNLVLYIAFLFARSRIAELSLETVLKGMKDAGEIKGGLQTRLMQLLGVSERTVRIYKQLSEQLTGREKQHLMRGKLPFVQARAVAAERNQKTAMLPDFEEAEDNKDKNLPANNGE